MRRIGMESSLAIVEAVKLADVDVIAAYPITPQTHIVERLSKLVANGELNAQFINVESEHSAMSTCLGASATGARVFTATSSQGLELMHEVLYAVSGIRLPIVMTVANRALSAPISIWGDHSDAMSIRDTGWIQVFARNGQECFDLTLCLFKIAENREVLLPAAVHLDGFHLTHVTEPILINDSTELEGFLPPNDYPFPLDPNKPLSIGGFALPSVYPEIKAAQNEALTSAKKVILDVWKEFGKLTGRYYSPIETYKMDDADTALLTMGSFGETASLAVDKLREKNKKVGLINLRLWRPFPFEELRSIVHGLDKLIILDRCLSFGAHPPVFSEVRSTLYGEKERPEILGFVGGLGGRDISPQLFAEMIEGKKLKSKKEFEMVGIRW